MKLYSLLLALICVTPLCSQKKLSFLEVVPFEKVPLQVSTSFDNYLPDQLITYSRFELLGLDKISEAEGFSDAKHVSVLSRLKLSDSFNTLIVAMQNGDQELFTYLINYKPDYSIIAWKRIAYDEIAESFSRTESKVFADHVEITSSTYADEVPDITGTRWEIKSDGTISK